MKLSRLIQYLRSCGKSLFQIARGSNIATFSVFLVISAFFWVLMKMNEQQQRDFNLKVEIADLPADVTLLTSELPVVNVSLRDKGTSLFRFSWGELPPLSFKYSELPVANNRLVIGTLQTNNAIRQLFGQATIGGVKPDSILIPFTKRPGKLIDVRIEQGEISVDDRFVVSGPLRMLTDTVRLYSAGAIPKKIKTLSTIAVTASGLRDTTTVVVPLEVPAGMRAIPDEVQVQIPVEPLIATERTVDIRIEGKPAGLNIVPFTGKVTVSYLVPLSLYNNESQLVTAYADYRRRNVRTSKMPVEVIVPQDACRNLTVTPDSIEYLTETER